jgi:hypothetical protein
MSKTVTVECRLSHGLILRVFEKQEQPFGLPHTFVPTGPGIPISPGKNPGIDADLFETWREQNKGTIYVHDDWITAIPEEPEDA